ncbi:MAG: DUF3138 family protein [candidate division Zixibacteria bacterium]|nr:DUF3138 family protein [candidate division Zixibacteria bacterium]
MRRFSIVTTVLILVFCTSVVFAGNLEDVVTKLEQQVAQLENNLSELEAKYQKDISGLQQQQAEGANRDNSSVEYSLTSLTAQMMELHRRVQELNVRETRIAQLEQKLEQLQLRAEVRERNNESEYANLGLPRLTSRNQSQDKAGWNMVPELQLTGFVDGSYDYNVPTGHNSFGFDQLEVNVQRNIGKIGSVRADIEWINDGTGGFNLDAEQGYVTFSPEFMGPLSLAFGKFNAPLGFEQLDAPDMYQFSHSLVFNYGLPHNLTGAMFSADLSQSWDMSVYLCNGWDQNVDINTGKTIGGRLGYAHQSLFNTGFSVIHGAQSFSEGNFLTVLDWDLTANLTSWWLLGCEVNYGMHKGASAPNGSSIGGVSALGRWDIDDNPQSLNIVYQNAETAALVDSDNTSRWVGMMLMNHWDYNEWGGITLRYDYFEDQDYSRFSGWIQESLNTRLWLDSLKRQAFTLAPTFELGHGMAALVEFRYDLADQEVFQESNGSLSKSSTSLAYEMIYSF